MIICFYDTNIYDNFVVFGDGYVFIWKIYIFVLFFFFFAFKGVILEV